jgi:hypothetical protein
MAQDPVRTNVRLPGELKKKIDRYARSKRLTFTHLVKVALETELLIAETVSAGGRVVLRGADGSEKELVIR